MTIQVLKFKSFFFFFISILPTLNLKKITVNQLIKKILA